jgi:uroporphyrinogen-III synthase
MKRLQNLHVLITRPLAQVEHLRTLIEAEGGQTVLLPTLIIKPIADPSALQAQLRQLDQQELAIFTSPNAVTMMAALLQQSWPAALSIAAVGAGTAQALRNVGLIADYVPEQFSSEGLLALPALQQISGKRIIIFKGEGGRNVLATTFRERGASVLEAIVYQREKPQVDLLNTLPIWKRDQLNIIVCTSSTGLQNLFDIMGLEGRQWLLNMPLLVVSERIANFAQQLGFVKMPIVADNATDEAIVGALIQWKQT